MHFSLTTYIDIGSILVAFVGVVVWSLLFSGIAKLWAYYVPHGTK